MKAVVLDGSRKGENDLERIRDAIVKELGGLDWDVEVLELRDMKMLPCTGCYNCWLKTPGICVINDDAREITKKIVQCDLLVLLSPVTFGGYSSVLKCALDRSLGMMLPFFKRIDGKVHHKKRYKRCPSLMAVGLLPEQDAEAESIFHKLIARNAINAHSPSYVSEVFISGVGEEEVEQRIGDQLKKVEVGV